MTELEKIEYARSFIDKLANGINPLDDLILPDGDIVNNIRISRCLFFVSDILKKVIDNGGTEKPTKHRRRNFEIPSEFREALKPSPTPMTVSEIAAYLNSFIDTEDCRKLSSSRITSWLVKIGALYIEETPKGKRKRPTDQGIELGIFTESRNGFRGPYEVILYNMNAQQFIIDNLEAMLDS